MLFNKKTKRRSVNEFPVPDLILRDAYLLVAKESGKARETFCSRTELIQQVKFILGPQYSHIPDDEIRDRIFTCCKNPESHGGGWAVTNNGHGKSKQVESPEWYKNYLRSPHWIGFKESILELWGFTCTVCCSTKKLEVHHRTYENVPNNEAITDCIVLCSKCHKRHHKYMSQPEVRS